MQRSSRTVGALDRDRIGRYADEPVPPEALAKKRFLLATAGGSQLAAQACARAKIPAHIAARKLRRSRGAVAFKAMKLGVSFRAVRQPPGAQRKANRTKRQRAAA